MLSGVVGRALGPRPPGSVAGRRSGGSRGAGGRRPPGAGPIGRVRQVAVWLRPRAAIMKTYRLGPRCSCCSAFALASPLEGARRSAWQSKPPLVLTSSSARRPACHDVTVFLCGFSWRLALRGTALPSRCLRLMCCAEMCDIPWVLHVRALGSRWERSLVRRLAHKMCQTAFVP